MSGLNSLAFERSYGVSCVSTTTGDVITRVSQPTWESFAETIAGFAPTAPHIGNLVLSPELITSTDIDIGSLASSRAVIEDRVKEAAALTTRFPDTTLLLGTVVFDEGIVKPRNALVFIKNGLEVGRTHKVRPLGLREREIFHASAQPDDTQKPQPNLMAVICSDLFDPPLLDRDVATLLVSGCWGVHTGYAGVAPSPDHRLARGIEMAVEDLFADNHGLDTIIMADRVPTNSMAIHPFNFVARR